MNQRSLTLDETARYAECPEMIVDMPGALHRALEHIHRLERAYEKRESFFVRTEDRLDDALAKFKDTFDALERVLDNPDPKKKSKIPALEALIRDSLKADIARLKDLLSGFDAFEPKTIEHIAKEF